MHKACWLSGGLGKLKVSWSSDIACSYCTKHQKHSLQVNHLHTNPNSLVILTLKSKFKALKQEV